MMEVSLNEAAELEGQRSAKDGRRRTAGGRSPTHWFDLAGLLLGRCDSVGRTDGETRRIRLLLQHI